MKPLILLIEDNEDDIALALRAFRKNHMEQYLRVARDGEEALDMIFGSNESLSSSSIQFIVLDLNLPKISGKEVLKQIKSHEKTKMIPVIILTTSKEERDLLECYQEGANSYILKPVNYNQFTDLVGHLCQYWMDLNLSPPLKMEG